MYTYMRFFIGTFRTKESILKQAGTILLSSSSHGCSFYQCLYCFVLETDTKKVPCPCCSFHLSTLSIQPQKEDKVHRSGVLVKGGWQKVSRLKNLTANSSSPWLSWATHKALGLTGCGELVVPFTATRQLANPTKHSYIHTYIHSDTHTWKDYSLLTIFL